MEFKNLIGQAVGFNNKDGTAKSTASRAGAGADLAAQGVNMALGAFVKSPKTRTPVKAVERSQNAAMGLEMAAKAADQIPVFGQAAGAVLKVAAGLTKAFGGRKKAKRQARIEQAQDNYSQAVSRRAPPVAAATSSNYKDYGPTAGSLIVNAANVREEAPTLEQAPDPLRDATNNYMFRKLVK